MSEFGSINNPVDDPKNNSNMINDSFAQFGVAEKETRNEPQVSSKDKKQQPTTESIAQALKKPQSNGGEVDLLQLSKDLLPMPGSIKPTKKANGKSRCIGHYMIGKNIGEGTFGKVKAGTHNVTGEKVSVFEINGLINLCLFLL